MDFDRNCTLIGTFTNHDSAVQFVSHVDIYLHKELRHGTILGPFDSPPVDFHISPFMPRPKFDLDIRTIIDLSWPIVSKSSYLSTAFEVHYPPVDYIIRTLDRLGL